LIVEKQTILEASSPPGVGRRYHGVIPALYFSLALQRAEMDLDSLQPARIFVAVTDEYAITRAKVRCHLFFTLVGLLL
jgi:hypothetical protein